MNPSLLLLFCSFFSFLFPSFSSFPFPIRFRFPFFFGFSGLIQPRDGSINPRRTIICLSGMMMIQSFRLFSISPSLELLFL